MRELETTMVVIHNRLPNGRIPKYIQWSKTWVELEVPIIGSHKLYLLHAFTHSYLCFVSRGIGAHYMSRATTRVVHVC
jgi:hypothetical protein